MKHVPLINQHGETVAYAQVDNQDYKRVSQFPWYLHPIGYAQTTSNVYPITERDVFGARKPVCVLMHRLIIGAPKGKRVDHIDRDKLNNTRANLRYATALQNRLNSDKAVKNKSGYKGVALVSGSVTFRAQFKSLHLGCFDDAEDAARAYDAHVLEHAGAFALTNRSLGLLA